MKVSRGVVLAGRPTGSAARAFAGAAGLLFPLANRPLIVYALEAMRRLAISEVAVVLCPDTSAGVRAVVADGSDWGLRVTYIEVGEPLGQAGGLLAAEDFVGGEPFVLHRADGLLVGDDHRHVSCFHDAGVDALLLVHAVDDPSAHAVVELERGRVREVVQHPLEPRGDLALAGVAILGPAIFAALDDIGPSWRGRLELSDALTRMARAGADVRVRPVPGWWRLGDTPADLLEGNRLALETLATRQDQSGGTAGAATQGWVVVDPAAELEAALIRGPAVIGPGARLVDAYVGPFTSIGANVTIEGAEIENSVVVEGATIRHLRGRLESSIIGTDARVVRDFALPKAMRVTVADGAEVSLV
jgi:glucose-1-phosphate thymidylyltransferase